MPAETLPAPPPGTGEFSALPSAELGASSSVATGSRVARARVADPVVLAAIGVLLLVSLVLRTRALHAHFWVDEGLSVGIASHPFAHIPSLLRQDGSPPLYYLILHVWMALRGHGEVATHELSLLFALITVPTAYWAGASLFDRRTGLIAAVLAAGAPYLTAYAQETRMYALLALLSLLVAASFVHVFVRRHRRHLPLFALSLAASLYTHNWGLFLGLMAGAAFLLCVRGASRAERSGLWRDGALGFGAVALLYAPWLPTVAYQAHHTGAPWDLPPVIWSLSQGLYSLVGGRGAAMALLLAGGSGLVAVYRSGSGGRVALLVAKCLFVLGIGTLLTAWVYSKTTPAWAIRYLGVVIGPLILLFAFGLARAGRLGLIALALTASFWVLDPVQNSASWKSNVASAIARVSSDLGPNSLVLSTQPEQVPTIAYYLPKVSHFATPLGSVPDPRIMDWRDAERRFHRDSVRSVLMPLLNSLAPGQTVALVFPLNLAKQPLWMKLIRRTSDQWNTAMERDRALTLVATTIHSWQGSGLAVRVSVYVRR